MAGSRGRYPPEYKEQIVELVRSGRSAGSLAPSGVTAGGASDQTNRLRSKAILIHVAVPERLPVSLARALRK